MNPAPAIDKLGFRRWYERKLIEAHAYFVTCFLCMIMVAASLESVQLHQINLASLGMLTAIAAGTWIAFYSFQQFRLLLGEAERFAEHSVCEHCEAYGLFSVIEAREERRNAQGSEQPFSIRVQCKKCGHRWHLA